MAASVPLPVAPADASAPGARPGLCPGGSLASHAPITITNDSEFTAANGVTGGNGTNSDPYVISCWSIQVVGDATGLQVKAGTKAFVIRDVLAAGSSRRGTGLKVSGAPNVASNVTVEHVTATNLSSGIWSLGVGSSLLVRANRVEANGTGIIDQNSPNVGIEGNVGVENTGICIFRAAATEGEHPRVTDNTCRGGSGTGLFLTGYSSPYILEATRNRAEGVDGTGFRIRGAVHAQGNLARGNGTGFGFIGSEAVAENNVIEANIHDGMDITTCFSCLIRDNAIVGNGSAGIIAFAIQSIIPVGWNRIEANHIGSNPFGIVFEYGANSNAVQKTDWTDGEQSFIRFADSNTIVDAGSDRRGVAGEPVSFHDYVAVVTVGPDPREASVALEVRWEFGDGRSLVLPPDALQGHAPPPPVSHGYSAPGSYTATLTVTAVDYLGRQFTLDDTVPVTIQAA